MCVCVCVCVYRREAAAAEEARRADEVIEKSIHGYDPWGKAGAGAPHRDEDGHVIADLRFQVLLMCC